MRDVGGDGMVVGEVDFRELEAGLVGEEAAFDEEGQGGFEG